MEQVISEWSENSVTDELEIISLVREEYSKKNYKKVIVNSDNDLCYIFFSSNGIYCPNTVEEFEDKICRQDRYEWENMSQKHVLKKHAGMYLFFRDLYKSWYVNGINDELNSIDKLVEFIKEETKGYRIITVGMSSGGYAATLIGCLLGAEAVWCYSGQFNINIHTHNFYYLAKYKDDEAVAKYYDLVEIIRNSGVDVFYLYPTKCNHDVRQYEFVKGIKNICAFGFDQQQHASTCYYYNMPYIMTYTNDDIKRIYSSIQSPIEQEKFYRLSMKYKDRIFQNIINFIFKLKKRVVEKG